MTRICIFGAGGVGGYLAGALARAGRDVSVVARGAHLAAIQANGLTVTSGEDTFTVRIPAGESLAEVPAPDVLVITAKATALGAIGPAIKPHLGPGTIVAFGINGALWFYGDTMKARGLDIPGERLDPGGLMHGCVRLDRSVGLIVRSQNEVKTPGHVLNTGGGRYLVGAALENPTLTASVVAAFNAPGVEVTGSDDLPREMWRKLVRNIAVALVCVPAQSSATEAFRDPGVGAIARQVMAEASAVAAAHGYRDVLDIAADAEVVARMSSTKPSIVQDLELGRPMEIDAQVLAVQDFARAAGVATPVIDALAPLVVLRARLAGAYPLATEL